MKVESRYDEQALRVTHVLTGELDLTQVFELSRSRPAPFAWSWTILWDCTGLTGARPTMDDLRAYRGDLSGLWPSEAGGKTAVVVSTDLDFGLGRMAEAYAVSLPRELRVFRDLDEARRWLDEPPLA